MSFFCARAIRGHRFASPFKGITMRRFGDNAGQSAAKAKKTSTFEAYKQGVNTVFKENLVGFLHLMAMGITLNVSIYAYNYQKKLKDFEAEYLTLKENDRLFVETFTDTSFLENLEKEVKASTSSTPIIAERILSKLNYTLKTVPTEERKTYSVPTDAPIQIGDDDNESKTRII